MRKLRVFDPFSLPLGLSSVLLERREGREERHRAAATAACSETGPPKPTVGAQPGSGSQACPKPALTPGEPEPEIPNPGPGASSSWCWPQSPCGWWYPAPGNDVGRNRNPSHPTTERCGHKGLVTNQSTWPRAYSGGWKVLLAEDRKGCTPGTNPGDRTGRGEGKEFCTLWETTQILDTPETASSVNSYK